MPTCCDPPGTAEGAQYVGAGFALDLADSFYQFSYSHVASFFGFDFEVMARDVGVERVWDEVLQDFVDVAPDDMLCPCLATLGMGFRGPCTSSKTCWSGGYAAQTLCSACPQEGRVIGSLPTADQSRPCGG